MPERSCHFLSDFGSFWVTVTQHGEFFVSWREERPRRDGGSASIVPPSVGYGGSRVLRRCACALHPSGMSLLVFVRCGALIVPAAFRITAYGIVLVDTHQVPGTFYRLLYERQHERSSTGTKLQSALLPLAVGFSEKL